MASPALGKRITPIPEHVEKRFKSKLTYFPTTGCLVYGGSKRSAKSPYGSFAITTSKTVSAHRLSYELFVEPVPTGMVVDHTCPQGNKMCCAPDHLEAKPQYDNCIRLEKCHRGHEFTEANTYIQSGDGRKRCKECKSMRASGLVLGGEKWPQA